MERHCLHKLASSSSDDDAVKKYVPNLVGVNPDADSNEWLVFDVIGSDGTASASTGPLRTVAPTLEDILAEDWIDQHEQDGPADPITAHHHLYVLQRAFGMGDKSTFGDVLDNAILELLRAVSAVNSNDIVHRDVKPGNLLVHSGGTTNEASRGGGGGGSFVLIEFGSGECVFKEKTSNMRPQREMGV